MRFAQGSSRWLPSPAVRERQGRADKAPRVEPAMFERAFRTMYAQVRHNAAHAPPGSVLAAAVEIDTAAPSATVLLTPGDTALCGRHPACQLRLAGPELSLRHVAVFVGQPSDSGLPTVRLWDLKTGEPFIAEDGVRTEALAAQGPLFALLGRYVIAIVPLHRPDQQAWPAAASAAWRQLPPREFVTRVAEGTGTHDLRARQPGAPISRMLRLGGTCDPSELSDRQLAVAELIVDCDARRERYYLAPPQLERGVLIGRYSRCLSHVIDDPAVSRVHLLIAAVGPRIYAIDTASSSGSATAAGRFDCVALGECAELVIGGDTVIGWRRYPPRQA